MTTYGRADDSRTTASDAALAPSHPRSRLADRLLKAFAELAPPATSCASDMPIGREWMFLGRSRASTTRPTSIRARNGDGMLLAGVCGPGDEDTNARPQDHSRVE